MPFYHFLSIYRLVCLSICSSTLASVHPSICCLAAAYLSLWLVFSFIHTTNVCTDMYAHNYHECIYIYYIHIRIHTQVQTSIENYEMWNHFYSRHDKTHMAWYHWDSLPCQALSLQTFPLARSPGRSNQCQRVNPSPSHCIWFWVI